MKTKNLYFNTNLIFLLCFLDSTNTKISIPLNHFALEPNPNKLIYFFGLMVALLIQILIIYEYLYNYVILSPYFLFIRNANLRYFAKQFKLEEVTSSFIDKYFWPLAISCFFIETMFCLLEFYIFNKSLLYLSLLIWTITIICSIFSMTVIFDFYKSIEDAKILERFRAEKILELDQEINALTPTWRSEEMEKHKENYNEGILSKRIEEYRIAKIQAIDLLLELEDSTIIMMLDVLLDDEEEELGNVRYFMHRLTTPTKLNIFNIIFYIIYLMVCGMDSEILYNLIYVLIFNNPPLEYLQHIYLETKYTPTCMNYIPFFFF